MLNNVVLVGRVVETPNIRITEGGQSYSSLTLAVVRAYKNSEGEYDTDFIRCTLWDGIAESVSEYCGKGSVIGIKGRIVNRSYEVNFDHNGEILKRNIKTNDVVVERVTFINLKKVDRKTDEPID